MKRLLMGFFGGIHRAGLVRTGGILVLVFLLVLFFGLKETPKEPLPSMKDWADISLSRVSFVQSQNGVKSWELTAQQAQLFEKDQTAFLKKISVAMKTQKGAHLTVYGDSGKMDMEGKNFLIQQEKTPVSIAWGNGYTIKTSGLHWSSEEKMIESDKAVTIVGSGISMRGDGLKIFLDRSELMLLGNIHAKVY
jgi:lipopolysaccharide export system protein LptC